MATSAEQQSAPHLHFDEEGLLSVRLAAGYNRAEQQYSTLIYRRIEQLLKGERNRLLLLRRYPLETNRLGIMPTPDNLDRDSLRITVVEKMAMDALIFLSEGSAGGPVAQEWNASGQLVETRKFPTKYPHIIIERVDVFAPESGAAESIEWSARRVQNQRVSTRINRMLDAANLGIDVAKLLLP